MSRLFSIICLAITVTAVLRINSLGYRAAYLKRVVLVCLAVGSFGTAPRPFTPESATAIFDLMFAGGILTSMIVRYYRPAWYADRDPPSHATLITRLMDWGK
jgi:hypothetical protein